MSHKKKFGHFKHSISGSFRKHLNFVKLPAPSDIRTDCWREGGSGRSARVRKKGRKICCACISNNYSNL